MLARDWRVEYSVRCYGALLVMYPAEIRTRFGSQMLQVFRDCCRDEVLVTLWMRTVEDLFLSLVQEHGRRLLRPIDGTHPLIAFVDSLLIPSFVGINLAVLGPVVTALLLRMELGKVSGEQFFITSATASLVLATLGVLRALLVARLRPTVRLWVKLS